MSEESIRETWNMECPKCGSDEAIHISATQRVEVRLCIDGTDNEGGDTEWQDDDAAWCTDCGFEGTVKDFAIEEVDDDDRSYGPGKKGGES